MVWPNKPIWAPIRHKKSNQFWFQICQDIQFFSCIPHIISACTDFSASCQSMNRSTPHSLIACTYSSFRIFGKYAQWNYIWRFASFCIFSVYIEIHSTNSNRFILHIISIHTDSLPVVGKCHRNCFKYSQLNLFFAALKGRLLHKTVCICTSGP